MRAPVVLNMTIGRPEIQAEKVVRHALSRKTPQRSMATRAVRVSKTSG